MFAITSFLKERGEGLVLFGHAEVVILGLVEVVMISKTLDMILAMCIRRVFVKDNKDNEVDDDEHRYFRLIT